MDDNSVRIRRGEGRDLDFVVATWLKSARHAWDKWLKREPAEKFGSVPIVYLADYAHKLSHSALMRVLDRADTLVTVACDQEDDSFIFGYAVTQAPNVIHWAHVRHEFRGFGVCRRLIEAALPSAEHLAVSYLGSRFLGLQSKFSMWFDPHAGARKDERDQRAGSRTAGGKDGRDPE